MTLTPSFITPRPDVRASFQLTEDNTDDAVTLLNGVLSDWGVERTDTGIAWYVGTSAQGSAVFGYWVDYPASPYSGNADIRAWPTDPTAEGPYQPAPSGTATYAFDTPAG